MIGVTSKSKPNTANPSNKPKRVKSTTNSSVFSKVNKSTSIKRKKEVTTKSPPSLKVKESTKNIKSTVPNWS